jgi:two-component system phosphate regulon response regulator PhoB
MGQAEVIEYGGVRIDFVRHRAFVDRREMVLTPFQFRLLECLLRSPGEALSRARLMEATGSARVRCIDALVKGLRKKLGPHRLIVAVYGVGYRLGPATVFPRGELSPS